ncbi:DUF368 domain-containing protein [Proteinivorax hydrogeniformans]|uniref:DUF368 domain-containing protein n=1 Tax=Proteinivorax hydrogeniformans TaxID=1826727 RepID=A0AAU8HVQ7_9FIRM
MEKIKLALLGIPLGISLVLPGLSFGTVALLLKVYDRILAAIKNFNLRFLWPIGVGVAGGILASSHLIAFILANYHNLTYAFLMGLILVSVRVTLNEVEKFAKVDSLFVIIGFFIAYYFGKESLEHGMLIYLPISISLVISGILSSSAMILPGISGATMLIMLGIYDDVLKAVNTFDVRLLFFFAIGVGLGLILFSWLLTYLLKSYRSRVMLFLSGLIVGSATMVVPTSIGVGEVILFCIGGALAYIGTNR